MPRDGRNFITVVATMPEHEKIEGLSDAAFRALIEAWCWCFRQGNDGRMSATSWQRRARPKVRAELEAAGLVDVLEDGSYVMHDYTEHQQTKADRERLSAARAAAGRAGGRAKAARQQPPPMPAEPVANGVASATTIARQTAGIHVPEQNRTEQTPNSGSSVVSPEGATREQSRRTAEGLISNHLATLTAARQPKPPRSVVAALLDHSATLIAEGIPPDVVREALSRWQTMGMGPGVLPSVVHEVQSPRRRPPSGGARGFDPQSAMAAAMELEARA